MEMLTPPVGTFIEDLQPIKTLRHGHSSLSITDVKRLLEALTYPTSHDQDVVLSLCNKMKVLDISLALALFLTFWPFFFSFVDFG